MLLLQGLAFVPLSSSGLQGKPSSTGKSGGHSCDTKTRQSSFRCLSGLLTLCYIDRTKGKAYGVFFPLPCGQTALYGCSREVYQRKKRKSQWGSGQFGPRQACMWEVPRLARRDVAKTWPGSPRKGPNCTAFCQFASRLCPGCTRAITVAGVIMGTIIPVINIPQTGGGEGAPSPIHGLFCFRFFYSTGGFSVSYTQNCKDNE